MFTNNELLCSIEGNQGVYEQYTYSVKTVFENTQYPYTMYWTWSSITTCTKSTVFLESSVMTMFLIGHQVRIQN